MTVKTYSGDKSKGTGPDPLAQLVFRQEIYNCCCSVQMFLPCNKKEKGFYVFVSGPEGHCDIACEDGKHFYCNSDTQSQSQAF